MTATSIEVRRRLLRLVERYPGLHLRELARQADASEQLAAYHVEALEGEGIVRASADGGFLRYYPAAPGELSPDEARIMGLLRNPPTLRIALTLLETPNLLHRELVQRLGLAKSTVSYHLQRLVNKDFLVEKDGAFALRQPQLVRRVLTRWAPPPSLIERFETLWETFYRRK